MSTHPAVTIAGKCVGVGHPPYVVAEAGVNHGGEVAQAHRLIDAARAARADAVKFQVFSADRLVSRTAPSCTYQKQHTARTTSQHAMLQSLELSEAAFRELKAHADDAGIQFLATPFGIADLEFLVKLSVPAVKIASTDAVNVPLLRAAADTGLPLILSTGACTIEEIDAAVALVRSRQAADKLILLHCVSAYPTRPEDARLRCVQALADRHGVPTGFSDHTPEPEFSALAVAAGAVILEKHLTLDRGGPGPDDFFSLLPEQMSQYVAHAHSAFRVLGDGAFSVAAQEQEVRDLARGSVFTVAGLRAGQQLTAEVLSVRRPGGGIQPRDWDRVIGCRAKADIPADTQLTWSMLR
ncbi:MAG: N-acetylneuraminate synthase family protein [Planctomycetota bacterium]